MPETFDCIVLGVGGFGSSALYHLARRGIRAVGLERFGVAHDRGSSHGETRIIRQAYFEHPDYVPLLLRAYELWRELETETGRSLFHQVGMFAAGPLEGETVSGTLLAARTHGLAVDRFTAREAQSRFRGYRIPEEFTVVFEAKAGYLDVEPCVAAHIDAACSNGATLRTDETVLDWSVDGGTVRVRTDRGEYAAAKLIVTAGPWAGRMLADLGLPLTVVRKPLFWFPASDAAYDVASGNSTFFFEMPTGQFYGFPRIDGRTVKVAEHTGGDVVPDPLTVDRGVRDDDLARLVPFLKQCMPGLATVPVRHAVCMYTKTPDCHFLIDKHPQHAHVVFGAGFSGHGFKFTTVIGEVLADLAMTGSTSQPVGFLSLSRLLNDGS